MLFVRNGGFALVALSLLFKGAPALESIRSNKDTRARNKTAIRQNAVPKNSPRATRTDECGECAEKIAAKARKLGKTRHARANVPCHPPGYVDPSVARDFNAAMRDLRRAGVNTRVTSAWRSSDDQDKMHRCSLSARCRGSHPGLFHAARPGESAHEGGFAVDISGVASGPAGARKLTPQGRKIVEIMGRHGYKWKYGLADPVHFEADPRKHGYASLKQAIVKNQTRCQARFNAALKTDRRNRATAKSARSTNPANGARSRTLRRS